MMLLGIFSLLQEDCILHLMMWMAVIQEVIDSGIE